MVGYRTVIAKTFEYLDQDLKHEGARKFRRTIITARLHLSAEKYDQDSSCSTIKMMYG